MGLGNYFKPKKPEQRPGAGSSTANEKQAPSMNPQTGNNSTLLQPLNNHLASQSSTRTSTSNQSNAGSNLMSGIKHEIMVNYLHQQQCANLWVSDDSGDSEGVLLRKGRDSYLTCPQQLERSPFATACSSLNVHVRNLENSFKLVNS